MSQQDRSSHRRRSSRKRDEEPVVTTEQDPGVGCLLGPFRIGGGGASDSFTVAEEESSNENQDDDGVEPLAENDLNHSEVCFLPDLGAFRFGSHPRQLVISDMERHQGVLWKRRDIFKNRWRPRWFVLHPGQGILTYYLLVDPVNPQSHHPEPVTPQVPIVSDVANLATNIAAPIANNVNNVANMVTRPLGWVETTDAAGSSNGQRSPSTGSIEFSENTLDYDVVPRGTIYLLGCTVSANEGLTKPQESLYAFTIYPPNNDDTQVHLAARTATARDAWVEKLVRVCRARSSHATPPRPSSTTTTPSTTPTTANRTATPQLVDESSSAPGPSGGHISQSSPFSTTQQTSWKSLGSPTELYVNVPPSLTDKIQDALGKYLPLLENEPDLNEWKVLYSKTNGSAFQLKSSGSIPPMIRSVALLDHPPKQVFSLLINSHRRQDYDTNIRQTERLKVLNPHTFLDYYATVAIWPQSPRDFAVVTHWQVLGEGDRKAIVLITFSCAEADALRPPVLGNIRANLIVNVSMLRRTGSEQCLYSRLLCCDFCGGVSKHFANVMIGQQGASLPTVIAEFLGQSEPIADSRLKGVITNEAVVRDVIDRLDNYKKPNARQRYNTDAVLRDSLVISDSGERQNIETESSTPSNEQHASILLAPVALFVALSSLRRPTASFWFLISAFVCVRLVVLLNIGKRVRLNLEQKNLGCVTCRFKIELRGVLRFIANKKEEREELKSGTADISVVHIVAAAVLRALSKETSLKTRRVVIPWLLIDEYVECSPDDLTVSISEDGKTSTTLYSADKCSVQKLADQMSIADPDTKYSEPASCMVLATPNFDQVDMETDVIPNDQGTSVVAVIGGIHLERSFNTRTSSFRGRGSPRPVLSLSLTMANSGPLKFADYRRFAEEVQKLLLFPEMCDAT